MNIRLFYHPVAGVLLALLSGVLLAFSIPPRNMSILGWIAFLPLLIAGRLTSRTLLAFCFGVLTSICCACILIGHISSISQFGNVFAAFGCLSLIIAFISSFASYGASRMSLALWPIFTGALGVTGELFGGHIFPASIAISQHANPGALHLASYTGIWGVSFILWFVPAAIIAFVTKPRRAWSTFVVAIALLAFLYFVPFSAITKGLQLRVAAIQAPDAYSAANITNIAAKKACVVVWPEHLIKAGVRVPYAAAKRNGVYVVANIVERSTKSRPYNSACLISPKGELIARSRKIHLFGKEKFVYESGKSLNSIKCASFVAGMPICFDSEFTDIARRLARDGAQILFVCNSDPNMPNSLFQYLHSAIIPFRAAENGTPIVWAEGHSLSMITDGRGVEITRAPALTKAFVSAAVRLQASRTFYNRIGDSFAYLCAAFAVIAAVMSYGKKNHQEDETIFI